MTTSANTFGGILPRFIGKRVFLTFTAVLVVLATTFASGYGQTANNAGKTSGKKMKKILKTVKNEKKAPGQAEFRKGIAAFEKKKFEEAVKFFRAGAEKGGVESQMMLSYCLEEGKGVENNEEESEMWLKKAADTGNPIAQAGYGMQLMDSGKREEGVKYLKSSSEQGCMFGHLLLGIACLDENEAEKGLELLLKVASLPPSDEKTVMDYMMDVEERALFEDKKISAMNGSIAVAQLAVGMAYLDRLGGVEPNPDEAKKWLRKAAASGLVPAKEMLEDLENMEKEDD